MALAYVSVQKAEVTGINTTITVTKPTSLATGDLMVAHLYWEDYSTGSVTPPSGFTTLATEVNSDNDDALRIYYKIADAGDVAASDFTFTNSFEFHDASVALSRWTGADSTTPLSIYSSNETAVATSITLSTMTPASAQSMIYIATGVSGSGGLRTTDSYSIATDNPSWTEIYDEGIGASNRSYSGQYGYRPETTATGSGSVGISGSGRIASMMFFINPQATTSTTTETITLSESRTYSMQTTLSETMTLTDAEEAEKERLWSTQTKSSSAWVNEDKS